MSRALSIRAIVVSTRAAVRSHRATGRDDLIPITIERGESLLEDLERQLRTDSTRAAGPNDVEDAVRELRALRIEPESEREPSSVSGRE